MTPRHDRRDAARVLKDASNRRIGYLRLSLTQTCQMRCLYCRPEAVGPTCPQEWLTPAELGTIVGHMAEHHGVRKVRRPDLKSP